MCYNILYKNGFLWLFYHARKKIYFMIYIYIYMNRVSKIIHEVIKCNVILFYIFIEMTFNCTYEVNIC